MTEYLLNCNAEINTLDQMGDAPIDLAIRRRQWDVIELLLRYKADFGVVDVLKKMESDMPPLTAVEGARLVRAVLENKAKTSIELVSLVSEINRAALTEEQVYAVLDVLHQYPVDHEMLSTPQSYDMFSEFHTKEGRDAIVLPAYERRDRQSFMASIKNAVQKAKRYQKSNTPTSPGVPVVTGVTVTKRSPAAPDRSLEQQDVG